jgi:hypothetical protein
MEHLSWERVRNSTQQAEIQQFLNEFPNGQHASEAKASIATLQNKAQQQAQAEKDAAARKQAYDARLQAEKDAAARKQADDARLQAEKDAAARKQPDDRVPQVDKSAQLQRDRDAIKQVLQTYQQAYEAKDWNRFVGVWPSAPRAQFQQTFKAADKIHVTLDEKDALINGDTATVDCRQRLEFVMGGKVSPFDQTRRFTLRKQQGRWFIEKDN